MNTGEQSTGSALLTVRNDGGRPAEAVAEGREVGECQQCAKALASNWFCRIVRGLETILLCSPECALRYFDAQNQEITACSP